MKKTILSKLWATVLTLAVILSAFAVVPMTASAEADIWDGTVAEGFAVGSGTEADPYMISTAAELAYLVSKGTYEITASKYFKLANDIYLNDVSADNWYENARDWFSRATISGASFGGTFDGAGYTIYGLRYINTNPSGNVFAALFNKFWGPVTFKNLIMSDVYMKIVHAEGSTNESSVAALAVVPQNGTFTFSNCVVKNADISVENASKGGAGGFVSYGSAATVFENCAFIGNVSAVNKGAFLGDVWWASGISHRISNSYAVGARFSGKSTFTGTNCYGTVAETNGTVTVVAEADMKGTAAITSMPGFDWNFWETKENDYPTPVILKGYAGGTGTEADPYLISNKSELVYLVKFDANSSGKYYKLTSDIYLNDTTADNWYENAANWYSSTECMSFGGTINGDGHTIYGLRYVADASSAYYFGLFSKASNAVIENLTLSDVYIKIICPEGSSAQVEVAAFVGSGTVTSFTGCMVIDADISILNSTGGSASGYLTWTGGSTIFDNCGFIGNIDVQRRYGAFLGDAWGSYTIRNCYAVGEVFSSNRGFTASNCYGTDTNGNGTVTAVNAEDIIGAGAKIAMPELNWYVWRTTDSYPMPAKYGYAGGEGTEGAPYVIETADDFKYLIGESAATLGNYYILANDISLADTENWFDSSSVVAEFSGVLDGNGYKISGLKYTGESSSNIFVGLIPKASNATVRNLVLDDFDINLTCNTTEYNATYASALIGYMYGDVRIENTVITSTVKLTSLAGEGSNGRARIGGFIGGGQAGDYDISNSVFSGQITNVEGTRYGGFVGDVWHAPSKAYVRNSLSIGAPFSSYWDFEGANNFGTEAEAGDTKGITVIEDGTVIDLGDGYVMGSEYPVLKSYAIKHGDANGDYVFDTADLVVLKQVLLNDGAAAVSDFTEDGVTDVKDIIRLKKIAANFKLAPQGENAELVESLSFGGAAYDLVWNDEFDSVTLDSAKWDRNNRMSGTNEMAIDYSDTTARIENGKLLLKSTVSLGDKAYMVPASVTTSDTMSFKYGYVEMRAKVPFGKGLWPSFWSSSNLALNSKENPDYTIEVDFFEQFASDTKVKSNIHKWGDEHIQYSYIDRVSYDFESEELAEQYHTFGFLWTPTTMTMYIDGNAYMSYDISENAPFVKGETSSDMSGFDTTLSLIINNHLFTASSDYKPYAGCEAELSDLDGEYLIDYVRLYQTTGNELNVMKDGKLVTTIK